MGAHDYILTIESTDRAKVSKAWQTRVAEDSYESGNGAYAGNSTTMSGQIQFRNEILDSEDSAREFILEHHNKWTPPLAVRFKLPAKPTERDKAREAKAVEHYEDVAAKRHGCLQSISKAFAERTSAFVACKDCGSKLSHAKLKEKLSPGRETVLNCVYNGVRRARTFSDPSTPHCPLCSAALLSETDLKRIQSHDEKMKAEMVKLKEALKPKASDEIAWAVGGWAAS